MSDDNEYDQDEDIGELIEVSEGHEQHHGYHVHEDGETIDFHLHIPEGDEYHESYGINLFMDWWISNADVCIHLDEEISCNDEMVCLSCLFKMVFRTEWNIIQ